MTIQELLTSLSTNLTPTDITLYPGASEQLIQQFETEMGLVLPDDFKAFYSFCNGFESREEMFRIIPLEEILTQRDEYQPQQFYVAEHLCYCDMWAVEVLDQVSEIYRIHNMNVTLTDSLSCFVGRFLQVGVLKTNGLYDWRNEVRSRKFST